MSTTPDTETLVLGGGFAGRALALALTGGARAAEAPGQSDSDAVTVVDRGAPRSSDAPLALLNPLAGRSLAPPNHTWVAYRHARNWLRAHAPPAALCFVGPALRLMTDAARERRLRRSYARAAPHYPSDIHHDWPNFEHLRAQRPWLPASHGVFRYGPAYAVRLPAVGEALVAKLAAAGAAMVSQTGIALERMGAHWRVHTNGGSVSARHVVLSLGDASPQWLPGAPLRVFGGALARFERRPDVHLDAILTGSGHIAPMQDGTWVAGGTYWTPEQRPASSEEMHRAVRAHASKLLPDLVAARPLGVWQGWRLVCHPDRQPLVGPVPGHPNLWLFTAFGAKALLFVPYLAELLAAEMRQATTRIPAWARPEGRISAEHLALQAAARSHRSPR